MHDETLLSFGLWIKRRRKALDLTQDALAARAALGEEAFQAAWAQGQQMTLEQAVAEALDR